MASLQNEKGLNILQRSMVSVVAYPGTVDIYPRDYVVIATYLDMADAMNTVYNINNSIPEGQYRAFIVDVDGKVIGFHKQEASDLDVIRCDGPLVC